MSRSASPHAQLTSPAPSYSRSNDLNDADMNPNPDTNIATESPTLRPHNLESPLENSVSPNPSPNPPPSPVTQNSTSESVIPQPQQLPPFAEFVDSVSALANGVHDDQFAYVNGTSHTERASHILGAIEAEHSSRTPGASNSGHSFHVNGSSEAVRQSSYPGQDGTDEDGNPERHSLPPLPAFLLPVNHNLGLETEEWHRIVDRRMVEMLDRGFLSW